jgi:hypothetical protein
MYAKYPSRQGLQQLLQSMAEAAASMGCRKFWYVGWAIRVEVRLT